MGCHHTEVIDKAVAATCTATGLTEGKHCSVCGEVLVAQETVDALGHRLENWIQLDPTCTEAGYTAHQRCSREGCGYASLYFELAPKGHTVVVDEAVEVTCTTDGKTEGSHCSVCNEVLVAQETITALGHDLENHDAKAPTYSEAGWEAYESCKREGCGYSTKVELAYVVYLEPNDNWTQANARFAIYFCNGNASDAWVDMSDEDGDGVYEAEILYGYANLIFCRMNPTGENGWTANTQMWNQTKNLTLSDAGNCYRIATNTWTEDDSSVPGRWYNYPCTHEYSEVTCTEDAVCGICGHVGTVAPGHTWAEEVWTVVTAPTTEADGVKSRECSVCGTVTDAILRQAEVKPMLYLTPNSNWKVDNARFAAYFFGNGEKWVSMTYNSELGVYEVEAPAGYPNVIFCRMNPGTTANNWNNKWNQTADLKVPADGTNHYTVKANTWDNGGGTWSTVTVTVEHEHVYYPATCTTVQTCYQCDATYGELADHNYGEWIVVVPSTCKVTGTLGHYTCSVCEKNFDADKNELESLVIDIDPDAHFDGEDENNNCDYCNASLCTEHTWNEGEVVTEATCVTAGSKKFTCTACGTTETRVTEALGHDYSADWTVDVPATCTEVGSQSHHCSRCDSKSDVTEIPATGHSYNKTVVTPATCTEDGYITITCRNCEKSFVSGVDAEADQYLIDFPFFNIGKKGHTEGEVVVENATSPDCVNNGSHEDVVYCTVCEVELSRTLVTDEALGHTNGDPVKEKEVAPDCENTGSYESVVYCTVCNAELSRETVTVNARGHYLVRADGKAATCTEDGYTEYKYCADCDYTEGKEVIPAGHKIVEVEAKAATCTEDGYTAYEYCENCDYVYGKEVIPAGHKLVDVEAKAATCTDDGYTAHKACENCDYTEGKEVVSATGHKDENGDFKCDACSTAVLPADGETLTIAQAIDISNVIGQGNYTTAKYYLTATITSIDNTTYGNVYVKDSDGNEYYIYGLYTWNKEIRYDAMTYKPVAGDEITVYAVVGSYYEKHQMKDAWIDEIVKHECDYTPATCTNPATCKICGATTGELANHVYENGECKNCGLAEGVTTITASKTVSNLITEYGWTSSTTKQTFNLDDNVTVKVNGGSNTGKAYSDHIRIYATDTPAGTLTISVAEGYELVSVKVSTVTGTYAFLYVNGTTTDICNTSVEVSGTSVVLNSVKNGSDGKQVRVTAIEVVYTTAGSVSECEHTGGEATCTKKAVCELCGKSYGELASHTEETLAAVDATCTETGLTEGKKCSVCGEVLVAQETIPTTDHTYVDGVCSVCGAEEPTSGGDSGETTPITASKTVAELITQYGWTSSTTKQTFNLDDNVTVKINGGSNTGKAYEGNHIRIYATDSPAGTLTISVPDGYELVSVKISAQTGTYAFLYVDGTTTDICNTSVEVSGTSVVLNSVKNGTNGKQVRVTAIEVVYKAV